MRYKITQLILTCLLLFTYLFTVRAMKQASSEIRTRYGLEKFVRFLVFL